MERFGTTDLRPARSKTWQQPKTSWDVLLPLLMTVATARQASFLEKAQETYCRGLDGFLVDDIRSACASLALQERPEGQPAMPSLGSMVTACQTAVKARYERARLEKEQQESAYRAAHPDAFCSWKELMDTMHEQQAKCAEVFGADWRARFTGVDLGDVYDSALEAGTI